MSATPGAQNDATQASRQFYTGTVGAVLGNTIIGPLPWRPNAERALDEGRTATIGLRSSAVWAALSILDATAITARRAYSRSAPLATPDIHVYRARLVPFHIGPLAVIDVLHERLEAGAGTQAIEPLIREYWRPTDTWHLQEILAESLTILEEVPPERAIYLRQWVHYNLDRLHAESLLIKGHGEA